MIIAIDGPAASGKGTLGKRVAAHFGLAHLDTGLLYREVARVLIEGGSSLEDEAAAARAAQGVAAEALDATRLRSAEIGEAASRVGAYPCVRAALVEAQRGFAHRPGGAVLDGRDIGTVICPDADVKLYVTASAQERAKRRWRELAFSGAPLDYETVLADILRRDARDAEREAAPLKPADDAVVIDTTALDADGALAAALTVIALAR